MLMRSDRLRQPPPNELNRRIVTYGDHFCGGGGSALGAEMAVDHLNGLLAHAEARDSRPGPPARRFAFELAGAVNHDIHAIATHRRAHPKAHDRHYCTDVNGIDLQIMYPEPLDLHWLSPACPEHSYCKRGGSVDAQSRASAAHAIEVARIARPWRIIVENVAPFTKWTDAFDEGGNAIRSRTGETFKEWLRAFEDAGYAWEYRILNCADYGLPQSRERFFLQARRDGRPIVWPDPTNDRLGRNGLPYWRGAGSLIDPSLGGVSLYLQPEKRPSRNTMERIIEGLCRHTLPAVESALGSTTAAERILSAFTVPLRNHSVARAMTCPLPTIHASSDQLYHPEMRLIPLDPLILGQHGGGVMRNAATSPLPTISTDGFIRVFAPVLDPVALPDVNDPRPVLRDRKGQLFRFDVFYRPLHINELCRGQGFESTYPFVGNNTAVRRMIGNAVPPIIANHLVTAALSDLIEDMLSERLKAIA